MKPIFLFLVAVFLSERIYSQADLTEFNQERTTITKNGMVVLSSWGVANIAVGAIGMSTTQGQSKYFYQMNLIWGAVNFAIAAPTYFSNKMRSASLPAGESVKAQSAIEKIFALNAGFDLAYIAVALIA